MRRLWTILSIAAVANLLALAAFVGWLVGTQRLNVDRVREIRLMLTESLPAQAQREQSEREAAEWAAEPAAPPVEGMARSSEDLVEARRDLSEVDRQRLERLRREVQDLQRELSRREATLQEQRQEFELRAEAFREERARVQAVDGSAQFKKSVRLLEGLVPARGAAVLRALMSGSEDPLGEGDDAGDGAENVAQQDPHKMVTGKDRAVSYLNAMQERPRLKVISELAKDEPELAAELLERLRTRGLAALGDQGS
ncbi:MAG: hypothetical protein H6811_09345 [Phycisphaeraceae bacterium]|nr:hypothetical protein [Phycisphaeraceae bacterium]